MPTRSTMALSRQKRTMRCPTCWTCAAIGGTEFFTIDVMVPFLVREASDEAELLLRKALKGDAQAFRLYFEALGRCSTMPEAVRDDGVGDGER